MKPQIELGLLFSRSGGYALISESCRNGALAAIAACNTSPDCAVTFVPVERDPRGNVDLYGPMCADIFQTSGARHVIGCVTSWSRKEVIPTLEKHGGTLWYPAPYEGFEASDHVVYTHACPNQHLLPLLDWAMPQHGKRAYLVGSNYIWGWEINRLARETVISSGGRILGERYLPIGSTEVGRMIDEIRAARPDFILNSLIGPSSYEFLAAYLALGRQDAHFRADCCPVLSCNLTECELATLGDAAEGLVAAGPYFRGTGGWPGHGDFGSSFEAAAFVAVQELARLLSQRAGAKDDSLAQLLFADRGAHGRAGGIIDPETHHTALPVLIGQVRGGAFKVIEKRPPVLGDPYLSRTRNAAPTARRLRVVT
jgi:branched-chain amino acid transport system substrate-binding protein